MPYKSVIPIAVFTYNRPDHAKRLLKSLSKCHRIEECKVYIFCDGVKTGEDERFVSENLAVAREWVKSHGGHVIERKNNYGLAHSIVSGVSQLCESYGRAIVLEDDLVLHPNFVNFMIQGLDYYKEYENVYQISGFSFPGIRCGLKDAVFLPLTTSWGWATWKRAWNAFDWTPMNTEELLLDPIKRDEFDFNSSYPFTELLESMLSGKIDSWGILWRWAVFKAGGLVLYPKRSLVWVGGFDGSGTHCKDSGTNQKNPSKKFFKSRVKSKLSFPNKATVRGDILKVVEKFFADPRGLKFDPNGTNWRKVGIKHLAEYFYGASLRA